MINQLEEPLEINPKKNDVLLLLEKIINSSLGLASISLSDDNLYVEEGSFFEINGRVFVVIEKEQIEGIKNNLCWIYFNGTSFFYDTTTPVFDTEKQGWYNNDNRAFYKLNNTKIDKMSKKEEWLSIQAGEISIDDKVIIEGNLEMGTSNIDNLTIDDYLEVNNGASAITNFNINTLYVSGTITAENLNIDNEIASGDKHPAWNSSYTKSNYWWDGGSGYSPENGYSVFNKTDSDDCYLQIYSSGAWRGGNMKITDGGISFFDSGKVRLIAGSNGSGYDFLRWY